MKTLPAGLATAVVQPITQPGHLVQIDFATPVCLSSRGTVAFAGHTFVAADIRVSGIRSDARGTSGGQLTWGNTDLSASALILGEGVADRRIQVWSFDATATGAENILPVFDGAGDSAKIGHPCAVQLTTAKSGYASSPRRFVAPPLFHHLSVAGREIKIGSVTMRLERGSR